VHEEDRRRPRTGTAGVALRYNGSSWNSLQSGAPPLTAIWGLTESDLFATGAAGTLLRFNGNAWSTIPTGTTDLLWSVSGTASAAGGGFAVGLNSVVLASSSNTAALRAGGTAADGRAAGTLEPSPAAWGAPSRGPQPHGTARISRRR
jgi:hypothetical protein